MKDLRNERAEVVNGLGEFGFEPVHTENWLPSGTASWNRIENEIASSDVFVLILGETLALCQPKDQ
jgi:Domain of unknown function (DUF4062)